MLAGRRYLWIAVFFLGSCMIHGPTDAPSIDREALVRRHIPAVTRLDPLSPFTVGNGQFAFTAGVTGLQTFADRYAEGIPLLTESQWGWHTDANPEGFELSQTFREFDTYGRKVPYASQQRSQAGGWLRSNPRRINLGRIGFRLRNSEGRAVQAADITGIRQSLELWEGLILSRFTVDGEVYRVETACHPTLDQIAVHVESEALDAGRTAVAFEFPYPAPVWGKDPSDWEQPDRHSSLIAARSANSVTIDRTIGETRYSVEIAWIGDAAFEQVDRHAFKLLIRDGREFSFTCRFSPPGAPAEEDRADETFAISRAHWKEFWSTGGAVDLSGSTDPRADELERRVVLSRYLTAIQCSGSLPPQETGLTLNSWYGKFHLEMHWWHAAHFVPWGKPQMLESSLSWYARILPQARRKAERQGYSGVRWPKMVGPAGRESPSGIGVFLIWQQPHLIYDAELLLPLLRRATGPRSVQRPGLPDGGLHGVLRSFG